MKRDPVCNMQVDESKTQFKSQHEGQEYAFCSQGCKEKFDRNPQQYVKAA
jgi:YHS domain-containing protein